MQKKIVLVSLGAAAAIAILILARPGVTDQSAPGWKGMNVAPASSALPGAPTASSLARKTPEQYNAMMSQLSENLKTWGTLHPDDQRLAVAAVMQLLGQQGRGKITQPPAYYADRINQTLMANKEVLDMPLDRVLVIMAVMDYDFDNGQDKDKLAQEVLGPSMYAANKARRQQQGLPV